MLKKPRYLKPSIVDNPELFFIRLSRLDFLRRSSIKDHREIQKSISNRSDCVSQVQWDNVHKKEIQTKRFLVN